ncbi:F-box domain [Dillenia turbinata]|uniref:F-box domain n=1 Tax=Dillenia turbinata TaxID=194707 RepID=A0AAN8V7K5_9MAGN
MASLSKDILFEILLRLPIKTIVRMKCVNRSWRTLIQDPLFVESHLERTKQVKSPSILVASSKNSKDESLLIYPWENPCQSIEVFPHLRPHNGKLDIIGTCDGIVLVRDTINIWEQEVAMFLWNPSINDLFRIPTPKNRPLRILGFGQKKENVRSEYKVVSITKKDYETVDVEIYNLQKNTWITKRDVFPTNVILTYTDKKRLVLANGSSHCVVWHRPSGSLVVLSFNWADEVFQITEFPSDFHYELISTHFELHGHLAFALIKVSELEIWVMEKFGGVGSLRKAYSFALLLLPTAATATHELIPVPIGLTESGFILFNGCNGTWFWYDPNSNEVKLFGDDQLGEPGYHAYTFFESLVPVSSSLHGEVSLS